MPDKKTRETCRVLFHGSDLRSWQRDHSIFVAMLVFVVQGAGRLPRLARARTRSGRGIAPLLGARSISRFPFRIAAAYLGRIAIAAFLSGRTRADTRTLEAQMLAREGVVLPSR